PIAVAQTGELIDERGPRGRSQAAPVHVILANSANEAIDVVEVPAEDCGYRGCQRRIAGDPYVRSIGLEGGQSGQAVGLAQRIEVRNRVIPGALVVAGEQVFAAGSRGTKERVADIRNGELIHSLGDGGSATLEV